MFLQNHYSRVLFSVRDQGLHQNFSGGHLLLHPLHLVPISRLARLLVRPVQRRRCALDDSNTGLSAVAAAERHAATRAPERPASGRGGRAERALRRRVHLRRRVRPMERWRRRRLNGRRREVRAAGGEGGEKTGAGGERARRVHRRRHRERARRRIVNARRIVRRQRSQRAGRRERRRIVDVRRGRRVDATALVVDARPGAGGRRIVDLACGAGGRRIVDARPVRGRRIVDARHRVGDRRAAPGRRRREGVRPDRRAERAGRRVVRMVG